MSLNEALFNLMHLVRNTMINKIKLLDMDLSPMHLKSLKIISTIDECSGQKLAAVMGRDKAQINRLLKELVSQEFLIKKHNDKDKRSQLLVLTSAGNELVNQFNKMEQEVFQTMSVDIPAQKIEEFITLANQLTSNLNAAANK